MFILIYYKIFLSILLNKMEKFCQLGCKLVNNFFMKDGLEKVRLMRHRFIKGSNNALAQIKMLDNFMKNRYISLKFKGISFLFYYNGMDAPT